jgi:hypothetical protein
MPNLPHPDEPELTVDESSIEGGYEVAVFPGIFLCIMPANKSGCQILFRRILLGVHNSCKSGKRISNPS